MMIQRSLGISPIVLLCTSFVAFQGFGLATVMAQTPREVAEVKRDQPVKFGAEILPMLKKNCLACHHAKEAEGGLVLETHAAILKGGDSGAGVVPSKVDESLLFLVAAGRKEPVMPPADNTVGAKPLTADELGLLKLWIEQGAPGGDESPAPTLQWQPLAASVQPIYGLAVSPDGQFAAVGRGNQVDVYHVPTKALSGKLIDRQIPLLAGQTEPRAADLDVVQSIAFSPDGQRIATGGYRTVRIWRRAMDPVAVAGTPWTSATGLSVASHQGGRVAVATAENKIEIWDVATRQRQHLLQGPAEPVTIMAWTPDDQRIVTEDAAGRLVVWDFATGAPAIIREGVGKIVSLIAASDLGLIAGVEESGKLSLWTKVQGPPPAEGAAAPAPTLEPKAIEPWNGIADATAIAWVAGATPQIAMSTRGGKILICEPAGGTTVRAIEHGAAVQTIALSPDGQLIAAAGADGVTKLWGVADGAAKGTFGGDFRMERQVLIAQRDHARQKGRAERLTAHTANLEKALQAENEAKAKVQMGRDKAAEELAAKVKKRDEAMAAMAETEKAIQQAKDDIAAAQKAMEEATKRMETYTAMMDGKKKEVDAAEVERGKAEQELTKHDQTLASANAAVERATQAIPAHQAVVAAENQKATEFQQRVEQTQQQHATTRTVATTVTFSRDGQQVITAHPSGTVRAYKSDGTLGYASFDSTGFNIAALSTASDQTLIASHPGVAPRLWPLGSQWVLETTIGSPDASPLSDRVTALDFSRDGASVFAGSGPPSRFGELKRFEVGSGKLLQDFGELHSDTILGLKQSPDGRLMATCSADKTIRIVNLETGEKLRSLEGHTHHVLAVSWQDDCQTLASASADTNVKVWDVNSGEQKRTIGGSSKEITAISFVGQTAQVVAASADAQIRLLDVTNGQAVRGFGGAKDFQFVVAVSDDASTVYAGGQDGVLRAWKIASGELLHQYEPK